MYMTNPDALLSKEPDKHFSDIAGVVLCWYGSSEFHGIESNQNRHLYSENPHPMPQWRNQLPNPAP